MDLPQRSESGSRTKEQGHAVSHQVVADLLHELEYSLQANRKTNEGASHPDRNAQFEYVNNKVKQYLGGKAPVISVDTKKKELIGDFKNTGKELRPKGDPEKVRVHDFLISELGRANPYGIYDIGLNTGWVSVGVDHDTAEFAVESIRRWWRSMGQQAYPKATSLPITTDGGGRRDWRGTCLLRRLLLRCEEASADQAAGRVRTLRLVKA